LKGSIVALPSAPIFEHEATSPFSEKILKMIESEKLRPRGPRGMLPNLGKNIDGLSLDHSRWHSDESLGSRSEPATRSCFWSDGMSTKARPIVVGGRLYATVAGVANVIPFL